MTESSRNAGVDASDLDFTNASDMRKLNARINRAISAVCDEPGVSRITPSEGRCRHQARQSANAQVAALRNEAIALASTGRRKGPRDIVVAAR